MDLVIYIVGPIVALAMPCTPLLLAPIFGWFVGRGDIPLIVPLVALPLLVGIALPAASSLHGWPAPWWMAAMIGPYTIAVALSVWLGCIVFGLFVLLAFISYARRQ